MIEKGVPLPVSPIDTFVTATALVPPAIVAFVPVMPVDAELFVIPVVDVPVLPGVDPWLDPAVALLAEAWSV